MEEREATPVRRSDLIKLVSLSSVGALGGVVSIQSDADAKSPFNLTVVPSGQVGLKKAHLHKVPPEPTTITYLQTAVNLEDLKVPVTADPKNVVLYVMPNSPVLFGNDRKCNHKGDALTDADDKDHSIYVVVVTK